MSLYGLDILVDQEGKRHLGEISGIHAGMEGFRQIYGDDRVQDGVYKALEERYGTLTINNGLYAFNEYKKAHRISWAVRRLLDKIPPITQIIFSPSRVLLSSKSEISWVDEEPENMKTFNLPFEIYAGQESRVMNFVNREIPHETVNPLVAEDITRNKFLQYLLLNDSEISGTIVDSSLVGLGATDEKEVEKFLSEYDSFVVKPVLGSCGRGVRFLTNEEVEKMYKNSRGAVEHVNPLEVMSNMCGKPSRTVYIEDLIEQGRFEFESGVSIIQPFVDSKNNGKYSSIRAIVCNGKFVDAYERFSENPKVNLSQDAEAVALDYDEDFKDYCENIIGVFEKKSEEHAFDDFKKALYQKYIDKRGITSQIKRELEGAELLLGVIFNSLK